MHELKPGVHVRYYMIVKKKVGRTTNEQKIFRMGGQIIKIDYEQKYLVLTNGKISWSVQINDTTIFYRKMTIQEIKDFYENEISNMEMELNKLRAANDKLKNMYKESKSENDKSKIENDKLRAEISNIKKLLKKANII